MRMPIVPLVSLMIVCHVLCCHGTANARVHPPTASHLIFEYEDRTWQIDLFQLGFDGVDPTTLDRKALQNQVETIIRDVERPPQDASFHERQVIPHKNGRRVDRKQLRRLLHNVVGNQNTVLPLPVIDIEPKITTDTLSRLTEKVLGRYSTTFNPYNTPRVNNIELSSQAIDYVIIPPGSVFSFNETVGPRTRARGYLPAPVIVRGEYSEGVGGGICQTSSTLFNSVDQAGLQMIERVVHSKRVTYVPKGRDATVSWGGPDFKFKNNSQHPILLASDIDHGNITITVYSEAAAQFEPKTVPPPPHEQPQQERSRRGEQ